MYICTQCVHCHACFLLVLSPHHVLLDTAGCPMLLIFLPSFIISLCFPQTEILPKTQSVGQHAVLKKEALCLSPLVSALLLELWDTSNYCGMPHAAPGNWDIIAVFVYTHHCSGFSLTVRVKIQKQICKNGFKNRAATVTSWNQNCLLRKSTFEVSQYFNC